MCFVRELDPRLPITCSVAVLSMCKRHLFKFLTEPELSYHVRAEHSLIPPSCKIQDVATHLLFLHCVHSLLIR